MATPRSKESNGQRAGRALGHGGVQRKGRAGIGLIDGIGRERVKQFLRKSYERRL